MNIVKNTSTINNASCTLLKLLQEECDLYTLTYEAMRHICLQDETTFFNNQFNDMVFLIDATLDHLSDNALNKGTLLSKCMQAVSVFQDLGKNCTIGGYYHKLIAGHEFLIDLLKKIAADVHNVGIELNKFIFEAIEVHKKSINLLKATNAYTRHQ